MFEENKKAQTVLGLVAGDQLGVTLPHEHLLIDLKVWHQEPEGAGSKSLAQENLGIENLSWVLSNRYNNLDNLQLIDVDVAIQEAMHFKMEGGQTIVDAGNPNLGRDPNNLVHISRLTGLNVIMGTGYYVAEAQSDIFDKKTANDITKEIIGDIQDGIGISKIKSGIIGEIGCSWPLHEREKKTLLACAQAQNETGAAITIHPGRHENSPMEIIKLLKSSRANISRVVMGHLDRTGFSFETLKEIADTGCYLEYDCFSAGEFYPLQFGVFNAPCDRERIEQIMALINEGFIDQILMSQDVSLKTLLVKYGGQGYANILRNIVPQMIARDMTSEQIQHIMIENPRRLLSFIN